MALSRMTIAAVTPNGGPVGTVFTVTGSGFGGLQGTIVFDPMGVNIAAVITSWADGVIVASVPAGVPPSHFATLVVQIASTFDSANIPFWLPALSPGPGDGLVYQYPAADALTPDIDDPREIQAADVNRIMDRAAVGGSGGGIPEYLAVADVAARNAIIPGDRVVGMLVYTVAEDTFWQLLGGLLNANWMARSLGGGTVPRHDSFPLPAPAQVVFTLSQSPTNPLDVVLTVNDIDYGVFGGAIAIGGIGNRTVTWISSEFAIGPADIIYATYNVPGPGGGAGSSGALAMVDKLLMGVVTTGNNAATGLTISAPPLPASYVGVFVNFLRLHVGDGVKTTDGYFSADGGVTAKAQGAIVQGDQFFWNGVIAGFDLAAGDIIDFDYLYT